MSKKDAAPTLGWVVISHFNTFIVRVSLLVFFCVLVAGATIMARLDADCTDKPKWSWQVGSYVIDFGVSKTCNM